MRTSQSRTGPRLFRAGIAAVATAAVVLAGSAMPALAVAPTVTVTPPAGANSGSITATSSAFLSGVAAPATIFATSACADPYATATTNITATTTKTSDDTATITVPTTITLNGGAARTYYVCVYNGTTAGTSALKGQGTYIMAPVATPTVTSAPSGGGNTLTVNVPTGSAIFSASSVPTTFATGPCPAAYGTPAISATATKVTTTQVTVPVPAAVGGPDGTKFAICFYAGTSGNSALIAASSATAYTVTLPAVTLSSTIGPESTSDDPVNLTITGPSTFLTAVTAPAVAVVAAPASCGALFPSNPGQNTTATARKVASNKAAFTMPTGAVVAQNSVSTEYRVCLYSSSSTTAGKLLSSSTFTVAKQPDITAVLPNSGSALGDSAITVIGSNFPTTPNSITATLGGVALTSITPIDSSTFTAVTPAHAVGSVALTVTTAQGTDTLQGAFTYTNSIKITPNTAPSTATAQDVDVLGTGFLDNTFSTTLADSHIYLVNGVYNGVTGTGNTAKQNGPVAECDDVLVISDNELICSLDLTIALNAAGTAVANGYRSVTDAVTTSNSNIVTSASAAFTQADVGKALGESGAAHIAADTEIAAVLSDTQAVMSNTSVSAGTGITAAIGYQRTSVTITSSGTNTLTGATGVFSQADVGRYVSGNGVGTGSIIIAVNVTGTTATLSVNTSGSVSSVTVSSGNPVPDGAYNMTVVSNGALNAALTDPVYAQTAVSSESIFTVAPF